MWTYFSPSLANSTLAQSPSGAVSLTASLLPSPSRSAVATVRALTTAGESVGHCPTFAGVGSAFPASLLPSVGSEPHAARHRMAVRSIEVRIRLRVMLVGRSRERAGSGMAPR